jgi:predicted RNA-binding Zn-ribbon protein involved in translation (DUF1610 family)
MLAKGRTTMTDFVTLTCPSCGGKLNITSDIERFACAHCGQEHLVRRGEGVVSLSPVVAEMKGVRAGVDKTASELALSRLEKEIHDLSAQKAALIASTPRPQVRLLVIFVIALGLLLGAASLFTLHDNGWTPVVCSALMVGFGSLVAYITSQSGRRWDRDFPPKVAALDAEITKRELEYEHHRRIIIDK